ncbi:RNA polymerase sigma factor [Sporosarcina cyprini]|uniref:RNA polymerase sigma factor n=1 Tax=Sporosarcina cyprini TaxID=2910523 RepID=UPI001EE0314A|nr:RNA polymerase sigma factor [Sporosarcina cyprini]MCG3089300.1 RNA polymerase sigma factor [Sporosarcina cyprini]
MIKTNSIENRLIEIYKEYYYDVYRFVICFTGNKNDAEDLTQEVFIKVLNSLPKFDGNSSSLKTWIFSIAKHTSIDYYRKNKFITIIKDTFFQKLKATDNDPLKYTEQNSIKNDLLEVICKMRPNYRAVVILRGINDFSIKETAAILSCSESKVKVVYHRALKELEQRLNRDLYLKEANAK